MRYSERIKEDAGENALCTPLTVTGTIDELDRDFAAQLNSYTNAVVKLGSNLADIETTHRAALAVVQEEKKKDLERKRGKANSSKAAPEPEPKPGPVIKDGKPVFGSRKGSGAQPTPTLFDAMPEARVPAETKPDFPQASTGAVAGGDGE